MAGLTHAFYIIISKKMSKTKSEFRRAKFFFRVNLDDITVGICHIWIDRVFFYRHILLIKRRQDGKKYHRQNADNGDHGPEDFEFFVVVHISLMQTDLVDI